MSIPRRSFLKYSALVTAGLAFPFGKNAGAENFGMIGESRIFILGVMQDAGLPQLGDDCERCEDARKNPQNPKFVSCLGLISPAGKTYLFDATPDIKKQIDLFNSKVTRTNRNKRMPVDGIFLTHAHMGHYTGLMQLGFESLSADNIPVYATEKMKNYLSSNGPWGQLVTKNNIELRDMTFTSDLVLDESVLVRGIEVPHRQEYSDTVGYLIKGQDKSVLYIPDIDSWNGLEEAPEKLISKVDYAIIDGTFFSGAELPGRDMSKVPHPTISHSIERFKGNALLKDTKIYFTHFNHSNPILNKEDEIRKLVLDEGFFYAEQGIEFSI